MTVLAVLITLAVAATCVALTRGVSTLHRGAGPGDTRALDLMEIAFLNGGPSRAVDTALTTMYFDGRLAIGGPGIASPRSAVAHDPVERAVLAELAAAPNGALHTLRYAVMANPAVQEIGDGLAFRGLMVPPGAGRAWRAGGTVLAMLCLVGLPAAFVAAVTASFAGASVGVFLALVLPTLITGLVFGP
ncbi:TIGR04222 domain-containing membrane protein, partial [Streptomyces albidochromogenes]